MLNLKEIDEEIKNLEDNGKTDFSVCQKLSYLYIVKHFYPTLDEDKQVTQELNDILPQYRLYCEVKRKYHLNELTQDAVIAAVKDVCREIDEFIHTLYSSTDMPQEREQIKTMITNLQGTL